MNIHPDQIQSRLRQAQNPEGSACPPLPGDPEQTGQPAAVLIPLLNDDQGWNLLFIKRTKNWNDRHSGQIAFPGGRMDQTDRTLQATALRETREEIGVPPDSIRILGQSCTITTVTDYQVSPFVGVLNWPQDLTLSPAEVEKVLIIPLEWLADPRQRSTRLWQSRTLGGQELPVIFFEEFQGEILWGATARIVVDFLDLILPD